MSTQRQDQDQLVPLAGERPELRLVDQFGEYHGRANQSLERLLVENQELRERVKGLEDDLASKRMLISKLRRDKAQERAAHKLRPFVVSVWAEWQVACDHPRSGLTADRFDAVLALAELSGKKGAVYGRDVFSRAIAGARFDPFVTSRRNGSKCRHDDLELICRDGAHLESFANRAPKGWKAPAVYPGIPALAEVADV